MSSISSIFKSENELNKPYAKINELFNLNIDNQLKNLGLRFETFHEIIDLVSDAKYYSIGIEGIDLNFQDRKGLLEVLIKFINKQISNIPNELEDLESQRSSRDFNDYRHFYDAEALSEKEGNLVALRTKLMKDLNRKHEKSNKE